MTALIRGVDVSTWQHPGNHAIDWEKVKAAGITFVLVKATQGDNYLNPWLKRDVDDANFAGLLVGAYHFYEVGPAPDVQAEHFVGSLIGLTLDIGVWLDWEPAKMSQYMASGMVNPFVAKVEETRRPVGIYTSPDWKETLQAENVNISRWWAADWGVTTPPEGCFIWQTGQETVDGIVGEVDANRLEQVRGVNLQTSPAAKPAVAAPPIEETRIANLIDGEKALQAENTDLQEQITSVETAPAPPQSSDQATP